MNAASPLIDTNVHLSNWPFRHLEGSNPKSLAQALRRQNVRVACVGSFDAILHRDIDGVNRRLVEACGGTRASKDREHVAWLPFGTVHLGLPDWQEDVRRCHERYHMRGIRIYPNYHQYSLDGTAAMAFFAECHRRGLVVQIVMSLEDRRTQHPLVRVPAVDPNSLLPAVRRYPDLPLMLLNAFRETPVGKLEPLVRAGRLYVELATLERAAGLERLVNVIPASRICYGSNAPLFYPSAARRKLQAAAIGEAQRRAIASGNVLALERLMIPDAEGF